MPAPNPDPMAYIREALKEGEARETTVRREGLPPAVGGGDRGPLRLALPWPPSVNAYWRSIIVGGKKVKPRVQVLVSERGREYRRAVLRACAQSPALPLWGPPLEGPLKFEAEFAEPDRRRRDLDNLMKAMLDALKVAGVYRDDSQIRRIESRFGPAVVRGGRVDVTIHQIGDKNGRAV